jgi:hypothetical protein
MSEEWIRRLGRRGEQLTRALVMEHAPELMKTQLSAVAQAPDASVERKSSVEAAAHKATSATHPIGDGDENL